MSCLHSKSETSVVDDYTLKTGKKAATFKQAGHMTKGKVKGLCYDWLKDFVIESEIGETKRLRAYYVTTETVKNRIGNFLQIV